VDNLPSQHSLFYRRSIRAFAVAAFARTVAASALLPSQHPQIFGLEVYFSLANQ